MTSAALPSEQQTDVYQDIVQACRDAATVLLALAERGIPEEHRQDLVRIEECVLDAQAFMDGLGDGRAARLEDAYRLREQVIAVAIDAATIWRHLSDH